MKRIALFIITLFVCVICRADTFTQYWYVEDNTPIQTTCTTGGDIILPTPPTKYGYDFIGWEQLPLTRIEYLESTGTQYIDTGFYPNQDTRIMLSYKKSNNTSGNVFGTRNGAGDSAFSLAYQPSNYDQLLLDYGGQRDTSLSKNNWFDNIIEIDFNKNIFTMYNKGTNQAFTRTFAQSIFQTNYKQILFGFNNSGRSIQPCDVVIYNCKIYDNDILVRDFIPVLDQAGIPCMFDAVEHKFYYNQGTGQFIAGPVVGN